MIDTEHLDRCERFANWLERRRQEAGFTQPEIARAAGISHSYYSKIVHIGQIRRAKGDKSREVVAPRSIRSLEGALSALEERLGEGVRDEGLGVWSGRLVIDEDNATVTPQEKEKLIGDTVAKLLKMDEEGLRLVAELVSRLS